MEWAPWGMVSWDWVPIGDRTWDSVALLPSQARMRIEPAADNGLLHQVGVNNSDVIEHATWECGHHYTGLVPGEAGGGVSPGPGLGSALRPKLPCLRSQA